DRRYEGVEGREEQPQPGVFPAALRELLLPHPIPQPRQQERQEASAQPRPPPPTGRIGDACMEIAAERKCCFEASSEGETTRNAQDRFAATGPAAADGQG